jgi:hypothetical protein
VSGQPLPVRLPSKIGAGAWFASVARPESVQRPFSARAVFYHQAKVIVVLEAVAAFESKAVSATSSISCAHW